MEEPDFLVLLQGDHLNLERVLEGEAPPRVVVEEISTHLEAERQILHPAITRYDAAEGPLLEQLRAEDKELEEHLATTDRSSLDDRQLSRLRTLVARHIATSSQIIDHLAGIMDPRDRSELAEEMSLAVREAPTHPHLPDQGPLREAGEELAAEVDRWRDRLGRR